MKEYNVFGHTEVTVCVKVTVPDGVGVDEQELLDKANKSFRGIKSYLGNGGADKLIGVEGKIFL